MNRPGAIFSEEQKDTSIELAFKYAVYKINKDRSILPKTTLVYDIQYVPDSTDSFRTSKKVCKQIENGVTAIFGKDQIFTIRTAAAVQIHFNPNREGSHSSSFSSLSVPHFRRNVKLY